MVEILKPGTLNIPDGATSEIRVSVKCPPNTPKVMSAKKVKADPAVNLVYSRHHSDSSALEALSHVLDMARSQADAYKILGQEELTFGDGKSGVSATLSLQVDEMVSLHQKHVLRSDGGVMTHFVLTGPARGFEKTDRDWAPRILDFKL